jgi:two-component system NtrC family response regulator
MANILIIDDDKTICDLLSSMVKRLGYEVASALTLKDGVLEASNGTFDVVLLDVRMPDGNGIDALPEILTAPSMPEVIIMTGFGDPDGAELAIKTGAWDYIQKPFSMEKFKLPLMRALQYREARKAAMRPVATNLCGIIGNSQKIKASYDLLAQAANSDTSVLITGETGTGKELFARGIHANSLQANKNFVVVDCAALPETIVESVLFGHQKGAFTGAYRAHEGLIKQADGGTLFLDEVGEIPMLVQKAFLRVLQEHRFRPVGGRQEIESDFRLVAATNKDLDNMVQRSEFRNDLLFRLRSMTIDLPPLRERVKDIKELTIYYVAKLCERYRTETKGFSPEFFDTLAVYDWPGNVRELINALESALTKARYEPILFPKHLPANIRIKAVRTTVIKESPAKSNHEAIPGAVGELAPVRDFRMAAAVEAEKQYLQHLISLTKHDIKESCRVSKLSRSRLYELLKKHRIPG